MRRRVLLDTGPAFDYLFGRFGIESHINEARRSGAIIGIAAPVLGEIVGGLEASDSRERSWKISRRKLTLLICWPYDTRAAFPYGLIDAELKRRREIIQQVDMQIAAVAKVLGNCTVISTDSDLTRIPGLDVENWRK